MKKRLMAVLLCVCMAAVLLTPYASVLTADGALRLGIAGAENDQDLTGESSSTPTEGGEEAESAETLKEEAPEATATAEPEATATTAPEATATTAPEATKAPAPKYTLDSNRAVYKDGATLRGEPKDCVVKASYSVAQAYKGPTDRSEAKTYKAGDRVRVYDEIQYEDCDGIERKWSVVLDGSDFYFVLSEALESAPELPAQTPAQTDMKSLFGIGDNVDPASIINPNTAVRTYIFMCNGAEITRQSVKNGDTLEPVTAQVGPNERFVKWVIKDTETEVKFGKVSSVTETETITVTAVVETVYTVYFKTADGKLVLDTRQGTSGDTISNFETVDLKKYQLAANQSVIGWQDESGNRVTFVTIENKDITLTAEIGNGYWITFDSNGGSYVAPAFFKEGEPATAPAVPSKPGYVFDKWYLNAGHTQVADFTNIKKSTILYAGWTESANVKYTVIYKVENADDNEYSYLTSVEKTGKTGEQTAAEALTSFPPDFKEDKNGFTVQTIKQKTIAGDGSTIVEVLYKRNVYTVEFYKNNGSPTKPNWVEYSEHRITAKYGANIRKQWPTVSNSTTWSTTKNYEKEGLFFPTYYLKGPFQVNIETMPLDGAKFYGPKTDSGVQTAYYYAEVLPGETGTTYNEVVYEEHHKDQSPGSTSVITDEDKYPITGFTYKEFVAKSAGSGDYYYNNAKFYYTRNAYSVVYMNNGAKEHEESYKYEADISGAGEAYKPKTPPEGKEGYVFDGWYDAPVGETKYEFTGKKMPANNITVYAKWVAPVCTVTVYDADKTKVLETFPDIPLGNKILESNMPKDKVTVPKGSDFLGWVNMDDHKPFNFDTEIRKNYSLYALVGSKDGYTVTYDANGGTGTAPSDPNKKYAAGTPVTVLDKGGLTHPNGKFFLGWATTADATTAKYQPGDRMIIDANITLYAVWGDKPATTTLTYNANYPGADPATKTHALEDEDGTTNLPNNTKVTLYGENTFTRQGYKLIGWAKTADATKADYDFGAKVIVDTIGGAAANTLYAVWEQSTTTVTVKKVVEGNFGDKTREFNFHAYWYGAEKKHFEFSLKNGGTHDITNVPIGTTLYVKETDADLTGYVTTVEVWNGAEVRLKNLTLQDGYYTFEVQPGDMIVFTNTKNVVPDTGVILDSLPYVLILAVVALGAAGVVIRRRRSREDD